MLRVSVLDPVVAKGKGATRGYCQMPLSSLAKRADAAEAAEEDRAATKLQTIQRGRHARNSPPKPGATPAPGMLQRGKRDRGFAVPSADDDERERKEREEA